MRVFSTCPQQSKDIVRLYSSHHPVNHLDIPCATATLARGKYQRQYSYAGQYFSQHASQGFFPTAKTDQSNPPGYISKMCAGMFDTSLKLIALTLPGLASSAILSLAGTASMTTTSLAPLRNAQRTAHCPIGPKPVRITTRKTYQALYNKIRVNHLPHTPTISPSLTPVSTTEW